MSISRALFDRYDQYQQHRRLQDLVVPSGSRLPLKTLILLIEKKMGFVLGSKGLEKYVSHLERSLQRMDRSDIKPSQIMGYQIVGALFGCLFLGLVSDSVDLALLGTFLFGGLPLFWIRDQILKREGQLIRDLPNALEMLSLCSEAGLSLEQAIEQYLKIAKKHPLRDELGRVLEQTRAGSNRKRALETISARLDLTDFSLFASSVIQAERFGTGIAKTLRQLSLTLRDKQTQRAEKAVQEMPVKMLFPLVLFIMPVTFLIIFGPIVLQFLKP